MRILLLVVLCSAAATARAGDLTNVTNPAPRFSGLAAPDTLSPELRQFPVCEGSRPLENPTATIGYYGYLFDGPMLPAPGDQPAPGHKVEASKTEPDKNLYLVLEGQKGADPHHDYGTHFLFQGHEAGAGHFTRINLDADGDHRVTLMADTDVDGNPLPTFDGITWDPFARRILLTAEGGPQGGAWQATTDLPSKVEYLGGSMGRAGAEGIQADSDGNLWIVEDVGGKSGSAANHLNHARQPNSFVYRFVPEQPRDLKHGKLQVLQVLDEAGHAMVFHDGDADGDILGDAMAALHTYGASYDTRWVTIHDTAIDGAAVFDANALAKIKGGTPFKRPENGVFRPDGNFREFYFTETGDTSASSEAGAAFGGFGGIFRIVQDRPDANRGTISLFYLGDVVHTGLDNIAFWDRNHLVAVEDGGDGLHAQRLALDSGYLFDTRVNYAHARPIRILAEGRDASATIDAGFAGKAGFQNDGDNEITGIHVSDGDPSEHGLLGERSFTPFRDGWRVFWTQQHGDNVTWEILPAVHGGDDRH